MFKGTPNHVFFVNGQGLSEIHPNQCPSHKNTPHLSRIAFSEDQGALGFFFVVHLGNDHLNSIPFASVCTGVCNFSSYPAACCFHKYVSFACLMLGNSSLDIFSEMVVLWWWWFPCYIMVQSVKNQTKTNPIRKKWPCDSKWPFHPLVGGHQIPLKGSLNIFRIPKMVTRCH